MKVIKKCLIQALKDNDIDTAVHQVNCRGVMGAGLAKQIRRQYPKVFRVYKKLVRQTPNLLGKVQVVELNNRSIVNLFGQDGYGRGTHTNMEALEKGLGAIAQMDLGNVGLPYGMGAGLAGGDWAKIQSLIADHLPEATLFRL